MTDATLKPYLFHFGYETPEQLAMNERHGWDDENSVCFFILAATEEQALSWGEQVAERFLQLVFMHADPTYSWAAHGYASWIGPLAAGQTSASTDIQTVHVGCCPDFARWK